MEKGGADLPPKHFFFSHDFDRLNYLKVRIVFLTFMNFIQKTHILSNKITEYKTL